jgi:hypothetical protein
MTVSAGVRRPNNKNDRKLTVASARLAGAFSLSPWLLAEDVIKRRPKKVEISVTVLFWSLLLIVVSHEG